MSTPPSSGNDAHDGDQQRIASLLAGLPDPGPMPRAVTDRVEHALREEQRRRAAEPAGPGSSPPAVARPGGQVVDLADQRTRRRAPRVLRAVGAVAAAAVVIGAGAIGYAGLRHDPAPAAIQPTTSSGNLASRTSFGQTGTDYTASALPTQAAALLATPPAGPLPASVVQQYGAVATSAGLRGCLGALPKALDGNPDHITVDLATFNGAPAVVVVVTKGSSNTAWVLSTTCTTGTRPLAGPTSIAT